MAKVAEIFNPDLMAANENYLSLNLLIITSSASKWEPIKRSSSSDPKFHTNILPSSSYKDYWLLYYSGDWYLAFQEY